MSRDRKNKERRLQTAAEGDCREASFVVQHMAAVANRRSLGLAAIQQSELHRQQ
jgi:hypothetical protein